jgi:hypothetical protein
MKMSAKNLAPLKAVLDLCVDAVKDSIIAATSGKPLVAELPVFANLITDIPNLLTQLPGLPGGLAGFDEPDAVSLIEYILAKGIITDAHAQAIVNAVLQGLQSAYSIYLTIYQAITHAAAAAPKLAEMPAVEAHVAESIEPTQAG